MGVRTSALLAAGLLGAAGCSSFERDWKAAVAAPRPSDPLTGPWKGEWRSLASGHSGELRSIITAGPEGGYLARYKAGYFCCFTFEYTVPMTVVREDERDRFHGSASLGFLAGGVYHYGGEATGGRFNCTYKSGMDHGVFEMERVAPETPVSK